MDHQHLAKIIDWAFDKDKNFIPSKYGCTKCDETFTEIPVYVDEQSDHSKHTDYVEFCFGCKVKTLELSTGDAGRAESMSDKKWNRELQDYRNARAQGIQPAGTSSKQIQDAHEASDKLGKAYNADVMPATNRITKQTAKSFTEAGVV